MVSNLARCGLPAVRTCTTRRALIPAPCSWGILGEGYAGLARRRADRAHSLPSSSRRAAPPIYPDLIYDRDRLPELRAGAPIRYHTGGDWIAEQFSIGVGPTLTISRDQRVAVADAKNIRIHRTDRT